MRSSRLVQTLIQAAMLVLLASIMVFQMRRRSTRAGGDSAPAAIRAPSHAAIVRSYTEYFQDHETAKQKAQLIAVDVRDVAVDGHVAHAKLRIELKWISHNPDYQDGPLKGAPGKLGDTYVYTQVFRFRHWNKNGWQVEGYVEPPERH